MVLDEFNALLSSGLVTEEEALEFAGSRPEHVEMVLTGRGAPDVLLKLADLVTEMGAVKHPYETGTKARKGIEY